MRLTRAVATWLAVATLLSACGRGDSDGAQSPPPPARLVEAITSLADANTGRFATRTVGAGGVLHSTLAGAYRLTPPAARVTVSRYDDAGDVRATEVVAIGRDAWSRERAQPPGDPACWIHYDVTELFANGLLVRNGDTYFPAPVAVVGSGRGVYSIAAEQISGTTELRTVLSVVDLSLPSMLSLRRTDDHRVPATFQLDGGEISGWQVYVRDAVERTRQLAAPSPGGEAGVNGLSTLGGSISTELAGLGTAVTITPPPGDQVIDYVNDSVALAERLSTC